MQAKDIMTTDVVTVSPATPLRDVAAMMIDLRISAVPVVDDGGHILGIVSDGDLMRRPETDADHRPSSLLTPLAGPQEVALCCVKSRGLRADNVMTRDVITVAEEVSIGGIAIILERNAIKWVPVTRDRVLVGIVGRANLVHALAAQALGVELSLRVRQTPAEIMKVKRRSRAPPRCDAAGCVRKGAAPRNLGLPPYQFRDDARIRIG